MVLRIQGQLLRTKYLFNFAKKTTATFGLILEDTGCRPRYINLCLIGNFNVTTKNKKKYDSYVLDCCSDIVPFTTEIINSILKKQIFRDFSTIVLKIFQQLFKQLLKYFQNSCRKTHEKICDRFRNQMEQYKPESLNMEMDLAKHMQLLEYAPRN